MDEAGFVIRLLPHRLPHVRQKRRTTTRPITSRAPRPRPRRTRRIRVPRKYTSKSSHWQWHGKRDGEWHERIDGWRAFAFLNVEEGVLKVFEALWARSRLVSGSPILARVTALGARVLRRVTHVLVRTLCPDPAHEIDLVVEYGLAEPDPDDKNYVDPLREWETSSVTYYRDSFGRRVYLQLDGASGLVSATDYRDLYDETESIDDDQDVHSDDAQPFSTLSYDDSSTALDDFARNIDLEEKQGDWFSNPPRPPR